MCSVLRVQPVFYMLCPALFFTTLRSRNQRTRLRGGYGIEESLYKDLVEFTGGQPNPDHRALLLRREYVNEITGVVGYLLGGFLFMRPN